MKPIFDFVANRTWRKGDYNFIHILPRLTYYVSPIVENENCDYKGKYYCITIGWLIWEASVEMEVRK